MKKITIIEYAERWAVGGIESYILNIIKLIDKSKFDIRIVVAQKESDFYDAELKQYGVHVESILNRMGNNPIERIVRNMHFFGDYLQKDSCDILHLHISQGVVLGYARVAKRVGVKKVIAHCHSTGIGAKNRFIKLFGHKLGKRLFHQYIDEMIACSDLAAKWLYTKKDIKRNKVKIFKCIIDVEHYKYSKEDSICMRKKYGLEDRKICLNIGRFSYEKNQLFLLDIFYEMLQIDTSYMLIIIGTGELEEQIHRKVFEYKIEKKVLFIESTREIEKYLSMADLFLLPSLYEGNPIVGIEAQASGLPCYFSDSITKQAKILRSSQFIQLSAPANVWARQIVEKQREINENRTSCMEIIKRSGYDKYRQIKAIESIYSAIE